MLTYEIHPILCDDIHYIDSQPFKVAKATKFDFCDQIIHMGYIVIDTHILYLIILQNSPSRIVMNQIC